MSCKFCGAHKPLIKAHVVPAGFFRRLRHGNRPPRMLTNINGVYPKKAPTGVYDTSIVCAECEAQFGPWDDYAQQLLQDEPLNGRKMYVGRELVAYEVPGYGYEALKLFFVSLLWRASASSHSFYGKIRLGPFERRAKELIKRRVPGGPEEFSVVLSKFKHPYGSTILDPHPEKFFGINYVRFYLGGYVAYVKVDQRKTPASLSKHILRDGKSLCIIVRDLERSQELAVIKNIIES